MSFASLGPYHKRKRERNPIDHTSRLDVPGSCAAVERVPHSLIQGDKELSRVGVLVSVPVHISLPIHVSLFSSSAVVSNSIKIIQFHLLIIPVTKCRDAHFCWSLVTDRLKSQKTDCSNLPQKPSLIKI